MDLDQYRHQDLDDQIIRGSRLEFYYLCPNAIKWLLPHYLTYCINAEPRLIEEHVEVLTYYFNPSPDNHQDKLERICALSVRQLECMIKFFTWEIDSKHMFDSSKDWPPEKLALWFEPQFEEMRSAIEFCKLAISKRT